MANLVMLVVCLFMGVILRTTARLPENSHVAINGFIIHIALPALILEKIHGLPISADLMWPVLMPWILFLISAITFAGLARVFAFSSGTTGALIMTAGLANTSFVGLPMIETFYGPRDLPTGILIDQLGTYLVLSTLGITVACLFSSGRASPREIALRIAKFPPLIALFLAMLLLPLDYPAWVTGVLHRLGDTLAPLALVSVGLQLRLDQLAGNKSPLACGLAFKLVVGPMLLVVLYVFILSRRGETTQVTLFEAAMGPQIGGAIVGIQYGLNPQLITMMVGAGIALSLVTVPAWYYALSAV
jgi:malate permease and related proteins